MKRKVAIRKLNRTLLKKEGTKEVYITGRPVFLPFFEIQDVDELPTSRQDERAKRLFAYKKKMDEFITLRVTLENNEVRMTGFGDYFERNGLSEVDNILLECLDDGENKNYYLDYVICDKTRVLQKYTSSDNSENYTIEMVKREVKNKSTGNMDIRESIQLTDKVPPIENYDNAYWLWDDSFDKDRWGDLINKDIQAVFLNRGAVKKKTICIKSLGKSFKKIMKAQTNSKNELVYQDKELFEILELVDGEWIQADFAGVGILEICDENQRIKIKDRDSQSFIIFEGGY